MSLTFDPLLPLAVVVLLGLVLAAADLAPIWRARSHAGAGRLALVSLFSLAAIATALVPLLAPCLELATPRRPRASIMIDASRSMATEDAGGISRFARAGEVAAELARALPQAEWEVHGFDRAAADVLPAAGGASGRSDPPGSVPLGEGSALGEAIARARLAAEPPSLLVLVSDGAQTEGRDPVAAAREARASGTVVSTVVVGSATRAPPPRIASVTLEAPDRVPVLDRVRVRLSAELEGLAGQPVEAALTLDGAPAGRAPLEAAGPRTLAAATFDVSLGEPGAHVLEAVVRSGRHETRATRRIRGVAGALVVALLDAPARWEHRYLARALAACPRLSVASVDLWSAEPDARATEAAIAAVATADVIVLGDVARRLFPQELGAALLRAVDEDGKGLLVLGGRNAFGASLELGLAPALPAEVGFDVTPVLRSFRAEETDDGLELLARALSVPESQVKDVLRRLPPLGSYEPLGAPRPGTTVLLESPGRRPLVVLGRWGLGRVGMIATDETWRWAFTPPSPTRDGPREAHRAILREIVAWLAARSAGLDAPITSLLARERVDAGSSLDASVSVSALSTAVAIRATLEDGAGRALVRAEALRRERIATRLVLQVPAAASGELVFRAEALDGSGAALASDEQVVRVVPATREERVGEPADPDLLVRVADAGGGAAFAAEDVARGDARRVLAAALDTARPVVREVRPLAQGASFVLVLALFLSATWALRRGAGLR
jgi:hypothetical protein